MALRKPLVQNGGVTEQLQSSDTLDVDAAAVFNESGDDFDFRIEGADVSDMFMVDASANKVLIGRGVSPGDVATFGPNGIILNEEANSQMTLRVEGSSRPYHFYVRANGSSENIVLLAAAHPAYESMDGGLFIGDVSTAPIGNPADGVFAYSESGVLKVRDGAGRVTSLSDVADGPASATDNALARFDGATGKLLDNSAATLLDSGRLDVGIASIDPFTPTLGADRVDATGWTSTGWTGDFAAGFAHTTGNTNVLSNSFAPTPGLYYYVTYTITSRTAGTFSVGFAGGSLTGQVGTDEFGPLAISAAGLTFTPTSTFDGTVSDIRVREITAISEPLLNWTLPSGVGPQLRVAAADSNVLFGPAAGSRLASGVANTLIGSGAGADLTTGNVNTCIGSNAGRQLTTGINNAFIGANAGRVTTQGTNNFGCGTSALLALTTGTNNCCIGSSAGAAMTTATNNACVGTNAGAAITTGPQNTFVGFGAGNTGQLATATNSIGIGNGVVTVVSNSVVIGNASITSQTLNGGVTMNEQGLDADSRIEGDTLTHMFFLDASAATENIALVAAAAPNWQTMDRGLFLGDATTAPTGNPTSGAFVYSNAGVPTVRTSGGVITPLNFGTVASGVYTPTRSAESNTDGNVTPTQAQYMRVGNTVTVSGRFVVDPTVGTIASFELSLPVASDFGAAEDAAGVAFCGAVSGQGAEITAVPANNTVQVQWLAVDVTSQTWSYTYTYRVI